MMAEHVDKKLREGYAKVVDLDSRRPKVDPYERICDDESIDVFMTAFWSQSPAFELLDSPNLRRRTAEALMDLRDYLRDSDERRPA